MSEASSLPTIANGKLQFEKLMEEVDNQLREEDVPIPARSLMAGLIISRRFNCSFSIDSQVGTAINTWFNDQALDMRTC